MAHDIDMENDDYQNKLLVNYCEKKTLSQWERLRQEEENDGDEEKEKSEHFSKDLLGKIFHRLLQNFLQRFLIKFFHKEVQGNL